jgi:hypothetical protein
MFSFEMVIVAAMSFPPISVVHSAYYGVAHSCISSTGAAKNPLS